MGAVVTFHPVGPEVDQRKSTPWAVVNADGTYQLQTYETGGGAPAGDYRVTIKWPWDVKDLSQAMSDRLGKAYSKPADSQWKFTIAKEDNELAPIEIQGAKVEMKPSSKTGERAPGPPGPTTEKSSP